MKDDINILFHAAVAQLVEQRTENPCVGSSTLPRGRFIYIRRHILQSLTLLESNVRRQTLQSFNP